MPVFFLIWKVNAYIINYTLYDAGITMNDVNPDYVIVGEGKSYSLDTLTKAVNLVLSGAKLIGANSDISGPIENGIAPACRALVSPIELATGKQAYFCGKPNPLMMRTGLNIPGCHSAEAVIVGDRMDTDIISGIESGIETALVLSGVTDLNSLKISLRRARWSVWISSVLLFGTSIVLSMISTVFANSLKLCMQATGSAFRFQDC